MWTSSLTRRLDDHIRDDERRFGDLDKSIGKLSDKLDQKHEENRKSNARLLYGIITILLTVLGWIASVAISPHLHFR